jgi:RNA polymerase sigma-70 factor (ECF subfamily)
VTEPEPTSEVPPLSPEELELRKRLAADPDKVLAEEFTAHNARFRRLVAFRLEPMAATRVDPDDVLQEAWLACSQRLPSFFTTEGMTFFVWMRLIVLQTIIDVHRRHLGAKKRDAFREVSLEGDRSRDTSQAIARQLLGGLTSPSEALMQAETARKLEAAIEGMEPIDREILALRHFEELTNSEVAEVLGIQVKAASIRYIRALKRLKDLLGTLSTFLGKPRDA